MRKGLTEVVFILDRSGSMRGLEADTIGGFNSMLEKQKKEKGEAYISTVLFDDVSDVIYDRVSIDTIEPMTDSQYYVRGCTALLDAVGGAIHHIGKIHKNAADEDKPEKTMFIITTDGMENSSRKYDYAKVKKMIEKKQKNGLILRRNDCILMRTPFNENGWEFIFLGANIDAAKEAGKFGISASRAFNYECDSAGTKLNYATLGRAVSAFRNCKASAQFDMELDECMAPVREDYKKRHK